MIMSGSYLALLLGESAEEAAELMRELPPWLALVGVAGYEIFRRSACKPGRRTSQRLLNNSASRCFRRSRGPKETGTWRACTAPRPGTLGKGSSKGAFQDIFFTTTLDKTPLFIDAMLSIARETGFPAGDIGVYLQPQNMGTSYHCRVLSTL